LNSISALGNPELSLANNQTRKMPDYRFAITCG